MTTALAGVRVLELGTRGYSSVTVAGRILSDLGADAVAVVPAPPAADDLAMGAKRFVPLDLTAGLNDSDLALVTGMVGQADVVLLDRGALDALGGAGLDRGALERLAPHAVITCISPFGLTGPWSDAPGNELTVQALTAIMCTNGYPGDPPVRAGIPLVACGAALLATVATLAALYEREGSGLGQFVDHSEYDSVAAFHGTLLPSYFLSGKGFAQIGNRAAVTSPWNSYRTSDGRVLICTMSDAQWGLLAKAIGRPEAIEDPRFVTAADRVANAAEIDEVIEEWTTQVTTREVTEQLLPLGLGTGPILTLAQVLEDPQARLRGVVTPTPRGMAGGPFVGLTGTPLRRPTGEPPLPADPGSPWPQRPPGYALPDPAGRDASEDDSGPLHGVRIVEVAALTAGPLISRLLGMLGATVIKVEPGKGESVRHLAYKVAGTAYLYFVNNTDKLGCTLEMGSPEDRQTLYGLAREADAFLTNLATSTMRANSLGVDDLLAVNPAIVYCGLSGFGNDGPYGGRKTVDGVVQGMSGIQSLTGFPAREPLKVAVSIGDLLSACAGTVGLLAGLFAKRRTGEGQFVDATLYDSAVWSTQSEWWRADPARTSDQLGNRHSRYAPYNTFAASDGVMVAIAAETDREWQALLRVIGRTDLSADERYLTAAARVARVAEVEVLVEEWARTLGADDVVAACWAQGVPAAVPVGLPGVAEAEHTVAREMIVTLDLPGHGPLRLIGSPFKLSRTPGRVRRLAPGLGEHNDLLLKGSAARS